MYIKAHFRPCRASGARPDHGAVRKDSPPVRGGRGDVDRVV